MEMTTRLTLLAAAIAVAVGAGVASAAPVTVNCPGTAATNDREFSLTTDPAATCFAFGTGNISGNPGGAQPDPLFALMSTAFGAGHVLIDKSDDGTSGVQPNALSPGLTSGTTGSWSFMLTAPAGFVWEKLVLAFKSGQGQLNPDWAAFLLPDGVTSGTWAISDTQALSHVNLYGRLVQRDEPPPAPIPLPATAVLLAAGLGGLAALRRRRKAT